MTSLRALLLTVLGLAPWLLVLAVDAADAAAPAPAPSARPDAAAEAPAVTLGELRADPAAWVGAEVRLVLQLDARLERWQPFITRFGPGDFAGYRGWADEAFLWERAAFENATERLFARRGTAAELLLSAARPYERFAARAVVREVLLGEPWIELLAVERQPEFVGEGTILHAARALELQAQGNADLARDQLERALAGLLPAHARAELRRLVATCAE